MGFGNFLGKIGQGVLGTTDDKIRIMQAMNQTESSHEARRRESHFVEKDQRQVSTANFCSQCGSKRESTQAKFCGNCGEQF